jgi:hypothetical protein
VLAADAVAALAATESEEAGAAAGVPSDSGVDDAWIEEQLWHFLAMHEVQSAPSVAALHGEAHLSNAQATCIALQEAHSSA